MTGEGQNPLSALLFEGTWRGYQQDALDAVRDYLADGRVHVVAAPGSGKTVLGIELARRLGRTTVVLAPTVAIRDQWVDRIAHMFLPPGQAVDAIASTRVEHCRPITVLTYQMLFSLVADAAGNSAFAAWLEQQRAKASTLVLDEAHHLRREWWKAIETLRGGIGDHAIVALTATPPYDVEPQEWSRYEALCGPIDAEIGAPALVQTGDLCPHQDIIHLSRPPVGEEELFNRYSEAMAAYLDQLAASPDLTELIECHPWVTQPFEHEEAILEKPDLFTSFLAFLAHRRRPIPKAAKKLLGVGQAEVPAMSARWMEYLLNGLLFELEPVGPEQQELLKSIERELRKLGSVSGDRVALAQDNRFASSFAASLAKLSSISAIARAEKESLGSRLRLLILGDQVRAADLPRQAGEAAHPTKIGIVPIFETLRAEPATADKLGVLTGGLVIVPTAAMSVAGESARLLGIDPDQMSFRPLPHDPRYSRLTATGRAAERMVALVTHLLEGGHLDILVGTQSLLGEGWDAPSVNALIIASNVGASMLSNQIRGRAIRSDPLDPHKTANIWHMATIVPGADGGGWLESGNGVGGVRGGWGPDMAVLERRFQSFEGLAAGPSRPIENGLGRMELPLNPQHAGWVESFNERMLGKAKDRASVAEAWRSALILHGPKARIRRQIASNHAPAKLFVGDTLQYLALSGLGGGLLSAAGAMRNMPAASSYASLALALGALTLFYSIPKTGKAIWLWLRNGTIERSLGQVARAVIGAMGESDMLVGATDAIAIHVERDLSGRARLSLLNVTREGERLILGAVEEIIGPVGNPRYLLVRRSSIFGGLRLDYHPVPTLLGQRRESAETFEINWRKQIGSCRLQYCRTAQGRRDLLRARAKSMANAMLHWQQQLSVWE